MAAISTEGSRRASRTAIATFLAPALVVYAVFTFYPVLRTFYNSVHLLKGRNVEEFVGFRNFLDILTQDPVFWKAVGNTATFTVVGTLGDVAGWAFAGALPFCRHLAVAPLAGDLVHAGAHVLCRGRNHLGVALRL